MSEVVKQTLDAGEQIRCTKCGKLLAKNLAHSHFEVKCPRCGTLNVVFEGMVEQVIITDAEGKILFINKAAEKVTGYSSQEVIGQKVSSLWGNQMSEEFYKKMWKTIKEERKIFQATLTNKSKTGTLYNVELVISPIVDTNGNIIFYTGIEVITKKNP